MQSRDKVEEYLKIAYVDNFNAQPNHPPEITSAEDSFSLFSFTPQVEFFIPLLEKIRVQDGEDSSSDWIPFLRFYLVSLLDSPYPGFDLKKILKGISDDFIDGYFELIKPLVGNIKPLHRLSPMYYYPIIEYYYRKGELKTDWDFKEVKFPKEITIGGGGIKRLVSGYLNVSVDPKPESFLLKEGFLDRDEDERPQSSPLAGGISSDPAKAFKAIEWHFDQVLIKAKGIQVSMISGICNFDVVIEDLVKLSVLLKKKDGRGGQVRDWELISPFLVSGIIGEPIPGFNAKIALRQISGIFLDEYVKMIKSRIGAAKDISELSNGDGVILVEWSYRHNQLESDWTIPKELDGVSSIRANPKKNSFLDSTGLLKNLKSKKSSGNNKLN